MAKKQCLTGPGLVVRMGHKQTKAGHAAVILADCGRIDQLLDPPGVTPETRANNAAKALLSFWDGTIDQAMLLEICGGDQMVAAGVQMKGEKGTLEGVAGQAKAFAEQLARTREDQAKEHKGALDAARR